MLWIDSLILTFFSFPRTTNFVFQARSLTALLETFSVYFELSNLKFDYRTFKRIYQINSTALSLSLSLHLLLLLQVDRLNQRMIFSLGYFILWSYDQIRCSIFDFNDVTRLRWNRISLVINYWATFNIYFINFCQRLSRARSFSAFGNSIVTFRRSELDFFFVWKISLGFSWGRISNHFSCYFSLLKNYNPS